MDPRKHRRRAERLLAQIEEARDALSHYDMSTLLDLLRRGEQSAEPDGYAAQTGYDRGPGGVRALVVDDGDGPDAVPLDSSTEAAAFRRLGRQEHDMVGEALAEIFGTLATSCRGLRRVERLRQVVSHTEERVRGRQSTIGECLACAADVAGVGEDRLKAGYCPACYRAWRRWATEQAAAGRDPSHVMFRAQRRAAEPPTDQRSA